MPKHEAPETDAPEAPEVPGEEAKETPEEMYRRIAPKRLVAVVAGIDRLGRGAPTPAQRAYVVRVLSEAVERIQGHEHQIP